MASTRGKTPLKRRRLECVRDMYSPLSARYGNTPDVQPECGGDETPTIETRGREYVTGPEEDGLAGFPDPFAGQG